jgi:hypothetical protein
MARLLPCHLQVVSTWLPKCHWGGRMTWHRHGKTHGKHIAVAWHGYSMAITLQCYCHVTSMLLP